MSIWAELVCDGCNTTTSGLQVSRMLAPGRITLMRREATDKSGWKQRVRFIESGRESHDYCSKCVQKGKHK
jgi:hypothetical protein